MQPKKFKIWISQKKPWLFKFKIICNNCTRNL